MTRREEIIKAVAERDEKIRADERAKVIDEILRLPRHEYKTFDGVDEVVRVECIYVNDISQLKGGD